MSGPQEQKFELHWYPGHMAKWDRAFNSHLQRVDVVVEVLDARMPHMSRHAEIRERVEKQHKPIVTVLNKEDLADTTILELWKEHLEAQGEFVILLDAQRGAQAKKALIAAVQKCGAEAQERWVAKGLKPRPIRTMVMGMPNVGKSSLINGLIGKKKVQTGHKAGVTRDTQWVRVHPQVELLDSPGILPPKLDKQREAHWLALVSSIGEAAFDDEEIARTCLQGLVTRYPHRLKQKYGAPTEGEEWTLLGIAERANLLKKGGLADSQRAAQRLIYDLRQGELGGLCFEHPSDLPPPSPETTD
jgi:ribosome biogenesis GTPase A